MKGVGPIALVVVAVVADDVAAPSMYAVPTAAATADKAVTATFEAVTATFALPRRGFRTFGFAGRSLRGDGRADTIQLYRTDVPYLQYCMTVIMLLDYYHTVIQYCKYGTYVRYSCVVLSV